MAILTKQEIAAALARLAIEQQPIKAFALAGTVDLLKLRDSATSLPLVVLPQPPAMELSSPFSRGELDDLFAPAPAVPVSDRQLRAFLRQARPQSQRQAIRLVKAEFGDRVTEARVRTLIGPKGAAKTR